MIESSVPGLPWLKPAWWSVGWWTRERDPYRDAACEAFLAGYEESGFTIRVGHMIRILGITSLEELEAYGEQRASRMADVGKKTINEIKEIFGVWGGKSARRPHRDASDEQIAEYLRARGWVCIAPKGGESA